MGQPKPFRILMKQEMMGWQWHQLERGANDLQMVQLMPLPPHHLLLH